MARSAAGCMTAIAIVIRVRPLEETRTPNSGCVWLAECEVEGRRFEARCRHGAANALARELVGAGFGDAPLEVHFEGTAGCMRWSSIAAAARYTISEGAATPISRVPWKEFPGAEGLNSREAPNGVWQNLGERPEEVSEERGAARHAKHATPVSVTCAGGGCCFG